MTSQQEKDRMKDQAMTVLVNTYGPPSDEERWWATRGIEAMSCVVFTKELDNAPLAR